MYAKIIIIKVIHMCAHICPQVHKSSHIYTQTCANTHGNENAHVYMHSIIAWEMTYCHFNVVIN